MYIQTEFTKDRPGRPPVQASFQLNLKHGRINFLLGRIPGSIPIRFPAGLENPFADPGPSQGWRYPPAKTS